MPYMPIKIYKDKVEIFDTLSTTNLSVSGTISGIDANKIGAASESQLNALSKTVNELNGTVDELSTYTGSLGGAITKLQQEVDDIALELVMNGVVRLSSWPATVTSKTIDDFLEAGVLKWASVDNSISNINNDGMVVSIGWSGDGPFGAQIWIDDGSNPASMKIRNRKRISNNTIQWNPWHKIVIESEDTYGISISGNAATATNATNDNNGNNISSTYAIKAEVNNEFFVTRIEGVNKLSKKNNEGFREGVNMGNTNTPVYFEDGIPIVCDYSLPKFEYNSTTKTLNITYPANG